MLDSGELVIVRLDQVEAANNIWRFPQSWPEVQLLQLSDFLWAEWAERVSPQGGFAQGTCFGGVLARKLAIEAVKMAASRVLAAKSTSAQ